MPIMSSSDVPIDDTQHLRERANRLQAAFSNSAADPGSPAVEAELRIHLGNEALLISATPPESYVADCRRDVCRMEATFESQGAADGWVSLYTTLLGEQFSNVEIVALPAEGGVDRRVLYGVRRH